MAEKLVGMDTEQKESLTSDLDESYSMTLRELGYVIIISNLKSQIPKASEDVQGLRATLETAGFNVKCYNDCNVQTMREIKRWMTTEKIHQNVNSFGLIFVYHKIDDQGFILDVFGRRAFNIDELTKGLNEVKTLHRKPKFIIIQTGNEDASGEIKLLNETEDFFIIVASSLSESSESTYVREFTDLLKQHYKKEPLQKIFSMTKQTALMSPVLGGSELMELAGKISSQDMEAIAVQKLGFDISEVKTLLAVHREDHRMFKFELLDRWKNRNSRNSKQKLIELLHEVSLTEGMLDSNTVDRVLKTNVVSSSVKEFNSFTHALNLNEFKKEKYDLKLLSTHATGINGFDHGFTVMPQSGDVVVSGDDEVHSTRPTLFVFSLVDGKLNKRKIPSSCKHYMFDFYSSLIINDQERLAVACPECADIKLYDFQKGEWHTSFSAFKVTAICDGGSDSMFVQKEDKSIEQLDTSGPVFKGPMKTLTCDIKYCSSMCFIPPPNNTLVVGSTFRMLAISADTGKTIHERSNLRHSVAFSAKYNVLLTQALVEDVIIVNPDTGCIIQRIDVSYLGSVVKLGMYNDDQVVILHWDDSNTLQMSFFKLSR